MKKKRTKKSQNTCVKIESSHYVHVWCIASWIVLRLNFLGGGFFVIKSRVCRFRFVLVPIAFFFRLWFVEASSFSASSATPPSPLFTLEMLSCKKKNGETKICALNNDLHTSSTTKLDLVALLLKDVTLQRRKRHPTGKNCSLKFPVRNVSQSSPINTSSFHFGFLVLLWRFFT